MLIRAEIQASVLNTSLNGSEMFPTLSRNALYAPLNTYLRETSVSSSKFNESQPVSHNLREKSLCTFLEKISVEYHNPASLLRKYGGNNGGQSLRSKQIEHKISQRALTLIGGGIGKAFVKSTSDAVSDIGVESDKLKISAPRKRIRKSGFHRVNGSLPKKRRKICEAKLKEKSDISGAIFSEDKLSTDILIGLNSMWNTYIDMLLKNYFTKDSKRIQIASLISTAELVGAHVIVKSKSVAYTGKAGVVVNVTKNTWRVATPLGKKTAKQSVYDLNLLSNDVTKWKVLIVPKAVSSLICISSRSNQQELDEKIDKSMFVEISGHD
mmetsp:Transcript_1105/g.1337  ORF Transcript_1105/g.1337 Transcript_1105/m.1337 type:complete len:325 (-) Transcript_1105:153-1127(-)